MKQKVTKDNWEALIHWNFALVGGFLGAYAILLHMGNFGSAQTGNIMEMAASLVSGEWYDVLLRFLALPLFGGGVVISYLLTNYTNINMRKLAIVVDAAGIKSIFRLCALAQKNLGLEFLFPPIKQTKMALTKKDEGSAKEPTPEGLAPF